MEVTEYCLRALKFEGPDYIPARVVMPPATWSKYGRDLEELVQRHPVIFGPYERGSHDYETMEETYYEGDHVDAWGCVWSNVAGGMEALVTGHPVATREAVHTLAGPRQDTGLPHGFMFQRLYYLRGFEELMVDFAEEPPELQMLIDVVLEHNLGELEKTLEAPPQVLYLGDDLGMQDALQLSPAKWRKYLKPCYREIFGRCHEAGCYVYFHSDGHILEVIPDLFDCGVDVINPQVRANGLDELVRTCKGRVCVDLDLDRQMFPFCTPRDIDGHVRQAVEKFALPQGGLWLVASCGPDVPLRNLEAICVALEKYRGCLR